MVASFIPPSSYLRLHVLTPLQLPPIVPQHTAGGEGTYFAIIGMQACKRKRGAVTGRQSSKGIIFYMQRRN